MKTNTEKAIKDIRSKLKKITDETQKILLREELKKLKQLKNKEQKSA